MGLITIVIAFVNNSANSKDNYSRTKTEDGKYHETVLLTMTMTNN